MESQFPVLKPATILHLKNQIEGNLKKPTVKLPAVPRPHKAKREKKAISADPQPGKFSFGAVKPSPVVKRPATGKRKRPDNGPLKGSKDITSGVNSIKLGSRSANNDSVTKSRLEEEILALGGEREDIDLILGAGSESEMEEIAAPVTSGLQKDFQKDLRRFVTDLGIRDVENKELSSFSEVGEPEYVNMDFPPTVLHEHRNSSTKLPAEKQSPNSTAKASHRLVKPFRSCVSTCAPIG